MNWALAPEEMLFEHYIPSVVKRVAEKLQWSHVLCQGTTSVVP
jgi:hypothetical protein